VCDADGTCRLGDPDFVRFIVQLNVLEVLFALADERFCMTLLQLSLQTIHDLERFISLCTPHHHMHGFRVLFSLLFSLHRLLPAVPISGRTT
jgi:hypothetical protein